MILSAKSVDTVWAFTVETIAIAIQGKINLVIFRIGYF